MDRNLYITNNRPFRPQRSCLNRTGPGEVSFMRIAVSKDDREGHESAGQPANETSRIRRMNISASFVGVVLKESNGKPSNSCNSMRAIE